MKYTQWIDYKGKQILLVNITNLNEDEVEPVIKAYVAEAKIRPGCPVLMDFTGTGMTKKTQQVGRAAAKELEQFLKEKGIKEGLTAIIGLSALGRTVANLISGGHGVHFSENLTEAKEWLAHNS